MITILYNKDDFEAASIALKAQSLSQNSRDKIYIVPKHYGRIPIDIARNLSKTKVAIFIAHDVLKIDQETRNELKTILARNATIQFVVPKNFNKISLSEFQSNSKVKINYYHSADKAKIIGDLSSYISNLNSTLNPPKSTKKTTSSTSNKNDAGVAVGVIGLLILLLAFTSSNKK